MAEIPGGCEKMNKHCAFLKTDKMPYKFVIDGIETDPLIFFFNTDIQNDKHLCSQVKMAAAAGIHLYSFPYMLPIIGPGGQCDFAHGDMLLEKFIAIDPLAKFVLRLYIGPTSEWMEFQPWNEVLMEHRTLFNDGSYGDVSFASDYFGDITAKQLVETVNYLENSKYAERVIVYHAAGQHSEMFERSYRRKGPDYSSANHARFRQYLKARYQSSRNLQKAWNDSNVDFETAQIPQPESWRLPLNNTTDRELNIFYEAENRQDWIDYSEYYSDMISSHIINWSRIIKEQTGNRKMTMAFYGYTFTLPSSFSGHLQLRKVLDSQYVDILCAPYDYPDRAPGGTANFMSPVDSVILHKKLWMNEDDARTPFMDPEITSQSTASLLHVNLPQDIGETLGVIERNMAAVYSHSSGMWWMDLTASGAFNSQAIWDLIDQRKNIFKNATGPQQAEVHVLIDEASKLHTKLDFGYDNSNLSAIRDDALKTSATVAYYLLDDFIAGLTPKAKFLIFANSFVLTEEKIRQIRKRIDADRSSVLWVYAPGVLDENDGIDLERVKRLTHFDLSFVPGRIESIGCEVLDDCRWSSGKHNYDIAQRCAVNAGPGMLLAGYASDERGACAIHQVSPDRMEFICCSPMGPGPEALKRILKLAGVHIYLEKNDGFVYEAAESLFVYTGKKQEIELSLPKTVELLSSDSEIEKITDNKVKIKLSERGCAYLTIKQ